MSILEEKVLVLNKNFSPINVVNVREAIHKVFSGIAEIIEVSEKVFQIYDFHSWSEMSLLKAELDEIGNEKLIRSQSIVFEVPRIIRVLKYSKKYNGSVRLTRINVLKRDKFQCQYCGEKKEKEKLTIDHIIPLSKGGKTIWSNVVTACYHCNSVIKKDKKLEETGLTLIKKPEIPDFLRMIIYDAKHPLHREKYSCWGNFISEVYWNIELEE